MTLFKLNINMDAQQNPENTMTFGAHVNYRPYFSNTCRASPITRLCISRNINVLYKANIFKSIKMATSNTATLKYTKYKETFCNRSIFSRSVSSEITKL